MRLYISLLLALVCLLHAAPAFSRDALKTAPVVPETVSADLQNAMKADPGDWQKARPQNLREWEEFRKTRDALGAEKALALKERLGLDLKKEEMAGVPVFVVEPRAVPLANENRILLNLHGGGYTLNGGFAGLGEAMLMASKGGFKVVSPDYRLAPQFPYPAALDDCFAVYEQLLKSYSPADIGVFGTSAGGALVLTLIMKAKKAGVPLPGAIAAGTPWSEIACIGDSYKTNENIDNVLITYDGWLDESARAYARGHDLKDPLISPIYGDFSGFPPAFLGTGTRDLFLSNTVRTQHKLLEADVPTELLVLEGISHAQYMLLGPDAPEAVYYYKQMARFFERNLGN